MTWPGPAEPARRPARYGTVAIAFHWAVAALVLGQLASGLWMSSAIRDPARQHLAYEVFQLHKAFGLLVLLLTLARLAWRLGHPAPPLPAGTPRLHRLAAHLVHALLYGLTLAVPLLGWLMVSASPLGLPTVPFGLFEWPHLPVPAAFAEQVEGAARLGHRLLAYLTAGLVALHVAAALKHQFIDRDGLIGRMLPWSRRPAPASHLAAE